MVSQIIITGSRQHRIRHAVVVRLHALRLGVCVGRLCLHLIAADVRLCGRYRAVREGSGVARAVIAADIVFRLLLQLSERRGRCCGLSGRCDCICDIITHRAVAAVLSHIIVADRIIVRIQRIICPFEISCVQSAKVKPFLQSPERSRSGRRCNERVCPVPPELVVDELSGIKCRIVSSLDLQRNRRCRLRPRRQNLLHRQLLHLQHLLP